jgi:endonuclease/exonuclease/phosphatase family metal-dependent hydrolase
MLANKYKYSMLIDGNDDRGIDVGLYSNYPITNIETHIFDTYTGANKRQYKIFSRDCAMYTIDYNGSPIHILCNHFKSHGYGSPVANDKKRQLQAERVQEIINQKFNLTKDNVVVAGDLNDTPDSKSLKPLLSMQGLENIIARNEGTHGTYLNTKKQFDYLLVSKALSDKYTDSRIERGGIFNGKNTIESPLHQASDHAAVVAEFKF